MPGNKNAYRLFSADGHALIDLMQKNNEPAPEVGQKVLCRHPFQESKRAYVIPSIIEPLYKVLTFSLKWFFLPFRSRNYIFFLLKQRWFTNLVFSFCRFIGKMVAFAKRCRRWKRCARRFNRRCDHFVTTTSERSTQRRTRCRWAMNCTVSSTHCGWRMHRLASYHDH